MTPTFANIEDLARFLIGMGYSYDAVFAACRKDFPLTPPNRTHRILYDAVQKVAVEEIAIDAEIERDAARAIGAEHDLSKTNKED